MCDFSSAMTQRLSPDHTWSATQRGLTEDEVKEREIEREGEGEVEVEGEGEGEREGGRERREGGKEGGKEERGRGREGGREREREGRVFYVTLYLFSSITDTV